MNRFFATLLGAGWGAGLMYFLDPIHGRTRQARMRDQVQRVRNNADDALEIGVRDLQNRVRGLRSDLSSRISSAPADDWVITQRARSRLGTVTRHPGAIEIAAQDGNLVVNGDILSDEVDSVMKTLASVRGVKSIDNRLNVHEEAGNIPTLQGEGQLPAAQTRGSWSPSTRLLAGVGTSYLLLRGMRGGFMGRVYTFGGLLLGLRAITNQSLARMLGMTEDHDVINVIKSIEIDAPIQEVYSLWSNFENFPRFMAHVKEISTTGMGQSHWVVSGPAGVPVEFDTVTTEDVPNDIIAWETVPGSTVKHRGQVRFRESRTGRTQVNVRMVYNPPAGAIGHAVATLFGTNPKQAMDADLARLKSLFEVGKTTAEGQTVRQEDLSQA